MQSVLPLFVQAKAEKTNVLHRPLVVVGVLEDVTNEHFVQAMVSMSASTSGAATSGLGSARGISPLTTSL